VVDTGALHLCIPEHVAVQLELDALEKREIVVSGGSKQEVPYAGPVIVSFANRQRCVGALILGDETLLGSMPIDDLDLMVNPSNGQVTANSETRILQAR